MIGFVVPVKVFRQRLGGQLPRLLRDGKKLRIPAFRHSAADHTSGQSLDLKRLGNLENPTKIIVHLSNFICCLVVEQYDLWFKALPRESLAIEIFN